MPWDDRRAIHAPRGRGAIHHCRHICLPDLASVEVRPGIGDGGGNWAGADRAGADGGGWGSGDCVDCIGRGLGLGIGIGSGGVGYMVCSGGATLVERRPPQPSSKSNG